MNVFKVSCDYTSNHSDTNYEYTRYPNQCYVGLYKYVINNIYSRRFDISILD